MHAITNKTSSRTCLLVKYTLSEKEHTSSCRHMRAACTFQGCRPDTPRASFTVAQLVFSLTGRPNQLTGNPVAACAHQAS